MIHNSFYIDCEGNIIETISQDENLRDISKRAIAVYRRKAKRERIERIREARQAETDSRFFEACELDELRNMD